MATWMARPALVLQLTALLTHPILQPLPHAPQIHILNADQGAEAMLVLVCSLLHSACPNPCPTHPQMRILNADQGAEAINSDFITFRNVVLDVTAPRCSCAQSRAAACQVMRWQGGSCSHAVALNRRAAACQAMAMPRLQGSCCSRAWHQYGQRTVWPRPVLVCTSRPTSRGKIGLPAVPHRTGPRAPKNTNGHHGMWTAASSNVLITQ